MGRPVIAHSPPLTQARQKIPKLSDDALRTYLESGHSQADAARHFGVSEPAIHQRLKRMRRMRSTVALDRNQVYRAPRGEAPNLSFREPQVSRCAI